MSDDYFVTARSKRNIEDVTLAWRYAFGNHSIWQPDIVRLIELDLPNLISEFAFLIKKDSEMGDAEAYTEFSPPQIVVRASVYKAALAGQARARMTLAHELGHLVMHAKDARLHRLAGGNETSEIIRTFESAEWQARKFASLFLMPEHIIVDCESASEIAERCGVSAKAAEIRFSELGQTKSRRELPDCVTDVCSEFSRR